MLARQQQPGASTSGRVSTNDPTHILVSRPTKPASAAQRSYVTIHAAKQEPSSTSAHGPRRERTTKASIAVMGIDGSVVRLRQPPRKACKASTANSTGKQDNQQYSNADQEAKSSAPQHAYDTAQHAVDEAQQDSAPAAGSSTTLLRRGADDAQATTDDAAAPASSPSIVSTLAAAATAVAETPAAPAAAAASTDSEGRDDAQQPGSVEGRTSRGRRPSAGHANSRASDSEDEASQEAWRQKQLPLTYGLKPRDKATYRAAGEHFQYVSDNAFNPLHCSCSY